MNWDDLRVFLAVYREGSFAGAGRTLAVDATTIGRRITGFEKQLGARLFKRTADGLIPTATAEAIVEAAEHMESKAKFVMRQLGGRDARLEGRVRLASTDDFVSTFLIAHLAAFRRMHPAIEIELLTSIALHDMSRGAADLAIRFSSPGKPVPLPAKGPTEVLAQRIGSLGIGVYGAPAYLRGRELPQDLESFEGFDLVAPEASHHFIPGFPWTQRMKEKNRVALTASDIASCGAAADAGIGICALPTFMLARFPNLKRLFGPGIVDERVAWMLTPADLRRVARVRALREFLLEVLSVWEPMLSGRIDPARPGLRP